jgi:hypothetical protein
MAVFELARSPWFWQVVLSALIFLAAALASGLCSTFTLGAAWLWSVIGAAIASFESIASRFLL